MRKFNSLDHIKWTCTYHIIFCPKYRRPVLIGKIEIKLKKLLEIKAHDLGIKIKELEVMPDHVHSILEIPPTKSIGVVIGRLKGYTSRYLREEFPELKRKLPSLWTNSYFIASVGGVTLNQLKQYVESQKNK